MKKEIEDIKDTVAGIETDLEELLDCCLVVDAKDASYYRREIRSRIARVLKLCEEIDPCKDCETGINTCDGCPYA